MQFHNWQESRNGLRKIRSLANDFKNAYPVYRSIPGRIMNTKVVQGSQATALVLFRYINFRLLCQLQIGSLHDLIT